MAEYLKFNMIVASEDYYDEYNYNQYFRGDILSAGFCDFSSVLADYQVQITDVAEEIPQDLQTLYYWSFDDNCLKLRE